MLGLAMFLQGSGEGAVRTFFNVYLDDALESPTSVIGVLVAIGQLASVPAALLMPAAARRWGRRGVFAWGTLGIAFGMLPLALVPRWAAAGAGYLVVIALVSLTRAAVGVYLMETMTVKLRTTMSGVYTMAMGLSWSAVALGGSRVITTLGYTAFFLGAAGLTAASAAFFAVVSRNLRYDGESA
jgi:predicted MFS family arabinose efflux permease